MIVQSMDAPDSALFSEESYLSCNPDVAGAVKRGEFNSGWSHFLAYGLYEARKGVPGVFSEFKKVLVAERRDPPEYLMDRVHGNSNTEEFHRTGERIALEIHNALAKHSIAPSSVLDFGCGCGRVLFPLSKLLENSVFYGTDIDTEAVDWLQSLFPPAKKNLISVNADLPPLAFDAEKMDFCYAVSVFTHLPVSMQDRWMEELSRVLKKNGILLITIQPIDLIVSHLDAQELAQLRSEGVFYKKFKSTDGLPEYYQAAWHTREYVASRWSKYFELLEILPNGIAGHHDLAVYRKI